MLCVLRMSLRGRLVVAALVTPSIAACGEPTAVSFDAGVAPVDSLPDAKTATWFVPVLRAMSINLTVRALGKTLAVLLARVSRPHPSVIQQSIRRSVKARLSKYALQEKQCSSIARASDFRGVRQDVASSVPLAPPLLDRAELYPNFFE